MMAPPSPAAPVFARLPAEINNVIFGLFCDHCRHPKCEYPIADDSDCTEKGGLATLSALSMTCKFLQLIAQPILHHRFPLTMGMWDGHRPQTLRLYLFVRTLSSRPDLANAVRSFGLRIFEWEWEEPLVASTKRDLKDISQAATRTGLAPLPTDLSEPSSAITDVEITTPLSGFLLLLALRLCENVQDMDLSVGGDSVALPDLLDGFGIDGPPYPVNIGCVRIHCELESGMYGQTPALHMGELEGLSERMPKIQTLHVCAAFLPRPKPPVLLPSGLPDGLDFTHLTRLELILCAMTEEHLGTMLSQYANLADLTYVSVMEHDELGDLEADDNDAVRAHQITGLLNRRCPGLRKTLRRLALEHLFGEECRYGDVYTSLRNLESVEEIYLGANGLFWMPAEALDWCADWDGAEPPEPTPLARMLPPGVRSLDILEVGAWKERVNDAVAALLNAVEADRGLFANLREIRVWENMIWSWLDNYPQQKDVVDQVGRDEKWDPGLEARAAAVGIKFSIEPNPAPRVIERLRQTAHNCG